MDAAFTRCCGPWENGGVPATLGRPPGADQDNHTVLDTSPFTEIHRILQLSPLPTILRSVLTQCYIYTLEIVAYGPQFTAFKDEEPRLGVYWHQHLGERRRLSTSLAQGYLGLPCREELQLHHSSHWNARKLRRKFPLLPLIACSSSNHPFIRRLTGQWVQQAGYIYRGLLPDPRPYTKNPLVFSYTSAQSCQRTYSLTSTSLPHAESITQYLTAMESDSRCSRRTEDEL